nr:MAG TPA: hypothetical protein [Bacteriophage sp.]
MGGYYFIFHDIYGFIINLWGVERSGFSVSDENVA